MNDLNTKEIMTTDEQERIAIQDIIDEYGCQVMQVEGNDYLPAFAYTIGLFQQFNHPEIICFGLSQEVLQTLLNNVKDRVEDEEIIEPGVNYKGFLDGDAEVTFLEVDKEFYEEYLGYGKWFYGGEDFPALQLVWPDKKKRFPWDQKFDENLQFIQPLLDRDVDFRFYESRQLGVFVTQSVMDGGLITYVSHDEEGDWFFLDDEDVDDEKIMIVALDSVVQIDPTINGINYLQYGWEARRQARDGEWTETKLDAE